jgi:hypothetical protein
MQQRAEWCRERFFLAHSDPSLADAYGVDAKRRPLVRQRGQHEDFERRGEPAQQHVLARNVARTMQRRQCALRGRAQGP